jgi:hypothetical protein
MKGYQVAPRSQAAAARGWATQSVGTGMYKAEFIAPGLN